ncbi:membrane protein insertion efficiency factor YidD [Demequina sp.]|uniref:membrane protein insertion efficiency factor YidD n=1 Tax=Demequina sp. TaxID=2050685 RepID=UPI0025BE24D1|nr:membrane protein insertion efficiency factor YidD [Demequina sp.]
MRILATAVRLPALALMGLIRLYQLTVSPLIGPTCKYYPSCSHYGLEAVRRHGALRGTVLAGWRVLRCNPWSNGGVDEVPAVGEPLFQQHHQTSPVAT